MTQTKADVSRELEVVPGSIETVTNDDMVRWCREPVVPRQAPLEARSGCFTRIPTSNAVEGTTIDSARNGFTDAITDFYLQLDRESVARDSNRLPFVIERAEGAWVTDVNGRRYLDMSAGHSASNFGHRHPALVSAARRQLDRVTLIGRDLGSDQLGPFCSELAKLIGKDVVLLATTGTEAVESAMAVAREWGCVSKGVTADRARVVVVAGTPAGCTSVGAGSAIGPSWRGGSGPSAPAVDFVPFGDADAVRSAVGRHTIGVVLEPIDSRSGVVVPPPSYLADVRAICDKEEVLFIANEIQSGLGRTGHLLATRAAGVDADVYVLGRALGGGIVPLSAVVTSSGILGAVPSGWHGSSFDGNPLACAIGREVIRLLSDQATLTGAPSLSPSLVLDPGFGRT